MDALPPDLQSLWDQMDAADRAADGLSERLSDEEFFWAPDEGRRWSVALCLDHLAVTNAVYGAAMREALDRARARGLTRTGPLAPGFFGRKFAESQEPPVKRRSSAPGKIQPRPSRGRGEILTAYHDAHDLIRGIIRDAATVDANRATFRNPFVGLLKVKVSSALYIIAAHDRRHLWQAEQVERALAAART
ncbi:MAG TPA: DinB family protein [Vicinamibacterales bacterium]|nr:DinB family protein [Vicinamibacterales bacterium]